MSVNPEMIQTLLAQQLMKPAQQPQAYGGTPGQGPQMQPNGTSSGIAAAGDLVSKMLLMKALQGQMPPTPGQMVGTPAGAPAVPPAISPLGGTPGPLDA